MRIQSSRNILSNISRTFKFGDNSWVADAIESIGDAVKGIGYHAGFEKKLWCLDVKDYCVDMPYEAETILSVFDSNWNKLLESNDISRGLIAKQLGKETSGSYGQTQDQVEATKLIPLYNQQYQDYLDAISSGGTPESILTLKETYEATLNTIVAAYSNPIYRDTTGHGNTYSLNMGTIRTNFSSGKIYVIGSSFKIDKDGFPYVIDEFNYTEALKFYVCYVLLLGGYEHKTINWKEAYELWEKYRLKASNKQKMPSIDKLESLTNFYTRTRMAVEYRATLFAQSEQLQFTIK